MTNAWSPSAILTDLVRCLSFLTRLRFSDRWFEGFDGNLADPARMLAVAGAVSAVPGIVVLLALALAGLPNLPAALMAVAVTVVVTGALHEDGAADTADGLAGRTRERRLEIMRDSANGTYGTLALVVGVAAKVLLLASFTDGLALAAAWIAAAGSARAAMASVWSRTVPARQDGAAVLAGRPERSAVGWALATAAMLSLPATILLGPWKLLAALVLCVLCSLALKRYAERSLGGHTGDVLGAVAVLAEIAVLLPLATT